MYSVSKSFVSIAIGFLEQDGVLSLDDPMEKYFTKELKNQPDTNMHKQTVRDMLKMPRRAFPGRFGHTVQINRFVEGCAVCYE